MIDLRDVEEAVNLLLSLIENNVSLD
jgi:hypothetical protein